jgi:methionine biosynthesis protein MetW
VSPPNQPEKPLRFDQQIIAAWIEPGSRVIDLGCGTGDLLHYLKRHKNIRGTGIEQNEAKVEQCISKGLTVLQGDINEEILDYPENAFDYVILSQTLQQVYRPDDLLRKLILVGRQVVVSFPNFSYWRSRLQLLLSGRAPKTRQLPFEWYDTPNIRVITLKDFREFAGRLEISILREAAINTHHSDLQGKIVRFLPNLLATYGIMLIGRTKD